LQPGRRRFPFGTNPISTQLQPRAQRDHAHSDNTTRPHKCWSLALTQRIFWSGGIHPDAKSPEKCASAETHAATPCTGGNALQSLGKCQPKPNAISKALKPTMRLLSSPVRPKAQSAVSRSRKQRVQVGRNPRLYLGETEHSCPLHSTIESQGVPPPTPTPDACPPRFMEVQGGSFTFGDALHWSDSPMGHLSLVP
jgi:hypothetical protein